MPTVAVGVALVSLVAWSFAQRWSMLNESPFPVGIDGYFYPIQLRALLEGQGLAYPASPLAFYLMAPFAAATDPIVGAKLGAAFYGALAALPAHGIGARLGKSRGAGLIAAVLIATSAGSQFLTFEFVKNGIGITLALTALWLVLRALEKPTGFRIAAAVTAILAAFLAHKMAAGLVIVVGVPAALGEAVGRGVLRGRRLMYVIGALLVLGGVAVVIGSAFPERFLSTADVALVQNMFTSEAIWSAPAMRTESFSLPMGHEAMIGGLLACIAVIVLQRRVQAKLREADELLPVRSSGERWATWMIVVLALAIALPWIRVSDPQGLGIRIRIVAFVPMALCAAIVARAIYLPIGFALVRLVEARWWRVIREGAFVAVALVIALAMPRERTAGRILAHSAMISAVNAVAGRVPAGDTVIVPERHIAYMVAWYARVSVRMRPESAPRERRWRLMPLAFIGTGPLEQALIAARKEPSIMAPIGLHPRHPNGFVLVAEPTWEWALARLEPKLRAYYEAWPTI